MHKAVSPMYVCFWHKADIGTHITNVRYWG